jgi:hypothetical protein
MISRTDVLRGAPMEWPDLLSGVVIYPLVLACLAALLAVTPRLGEYNSIRFVPRKADTRGRASVRWSGVAVLVAAFFAVDPLGYLDDGPSTLRVALETPPRRRTNWSSEQSPRLARVAGEWARRSGVNSRFEEDMERLKQAATTMPPRHIEWAVFGPLCGKVARDVDAMDALGVFPLPDGASEWSAVKSHARDAVDVPCHHASFG